MTRALLGLGGNIGDPIANMRLALQALDGSAEVEVITVSKLYRTPPWGKADQPHFFNAVAGIETALPPLGLLDLCLATERDLKRERRERWGPRTIDIDILDMEGAVMRDERLTLPHPRISERAFVLVPLADVAPEIEIAGRSLRAHLAELDRGGIEEISENGEWWRSAR